MNVLQLMLSNYTEPIVLLPLRRQQSGTMNYNLEAGLSVVGRRPLEHVVARGAQVVARGAQVVARGAQVGRGLEGVPDGGSETRKSSARL